MTNSTVLNVTPHQPEDPLASFVEGDDASFGEALETYPCHPVEESPVSEARREEINVLMELMNLPTPGRYDWYDNALTHSSYNYELGHQAPLNNYERLEFLGDAVLKLAISDSLYRRFPHYREGELTKIRAVVVSDAVLAQLAERIELGHYLILGPAEARSGGARKPSNLACAFEALLGALYLDGRLFEAIQLLEDLLEDIVTDVDQSKTKANYKAVLQELTQGNGQGLPHYVIKKEQGPSHNKVFFIEVVIDGEIMGYGKGKTKKEAQQAAAKAALSTLGHLAEDEV